MVNINLPPNLTEEEEILRQKYARLRKKVSQIKIQYIHARHLRILSFK